MAGPGVVLPFDGIIISTVGCAAGAAVVGTAVGGTGVAVGVGDAQAANAKMAAPSRMAALRMFRVDMIFSFGLLCLGATACSKNFVWVNLLTTITCSS